MRHSVAKEGDQEMKQNRANLELLCIPHCHSHLLSCTEELRIARSKTLRCAPISLYAANGDVSIGGLVGADALCSLHPFSVVKFYAVYWLVLYSTCFQNNMFQGIKASYKEKKRQP